MAPTKDPQNRDLSTRDHRSSRAFVESKAFWRLVVLVICVVWSTNFAVIKSIFETIPKLDASLYSTVRFVTSAVVMLPWTASKWGPAHADMIWRSGVVASFVFLGYFGQSQVKIP